ncbi:unnamed protein product, partial [Dibothriocephalus latus]
MAAYYDRRATSMDVISEQVNYGAAAGDKAAREPISLSQPPQQPTAAATAPALRGP